eukprot:NODE_1222_length_1600_cov_32.128310_g1153_i0.p1 GENE.NODE_1222_length_1600_cov_32.128310_g1153_i0~~NODE_1222_length_1600_cov_32.128310_g1153_i0.p1  ORF type:complete len:516 (-),score=167.96 NODE_1222_length_1600_cov_32.128310_g1153_i0:53-1546(-)
MSILISRWLCLLSGMLAALCCGLPYCFGLYSQYLKQAMHYTQQELNLISTCGVLTAFFFVPAAYTLSISSPRINMLIGTVIGTTGYGLVWAILRYHWDVPLSFVCFAYALATYTSGWYDPTIIVTTALNFPAANQGAVIGLIKMMIGLSPTILTQVYQGLLQPDLLDFLLVSPLLVACVGVFNVAVLNIVPQRYVKDVSPWLFACWYVEVGGLLVFMTVLAVSPFPPFLGTIIMLLWFCTFFALPFVAPDPIMQTIDSGEVGEKASLMRNDPPTTVHQSETELDPLSFRVLLYLFVCFCLMGSSMMVFTNIAQIDLSLAPPHSSIRTVAVMLQGLGNGAGRLLAGLGFDALARFGAQRSGLLVLFELMEASIFLWFAFASYASLLPLYFLNGFLFGSFMATMPALVRQVFGASRLGAVYSILQLGCSFGQIFFSVFLAAPLYDLAANLQDNTVCVGRACYFTTFLVLVGFNLVGCLAALRFYYITRGASSILQITPA